MPGRPIPLVNGEIYHVINRGIASQPTFINKRDYQRAQSTLSYYQNCNLPFRYSKFTTLAQNEKQQLLNKLQESKNFWVEILAYCLMPNHFHLLLKQLKGKG